MTTEICVMDEGRFEYFEGEQAKRIRESGKVYICQCDEETAPDYFAHFELDYMDECDGDIDKMFTGIEAV